MYQEIKSKRIERPSWLKVKAPGGESYANIHKMIRTKSLHTVCEEAHCPNIGECWGHGTATFLILGDICTRNCRFCAITTGKPQPVNLNEPLNVALAVKNMNIKHVVVTSVDRDDLPDGGSEIWAETIRKIREINPSVTVEVLIPDFLGNKEQLQKVIDERPDILNHNIETVPRLYKIVRPKADYQRSLDVLNEAAKQNLKTKSGLMVGLGETKEEVFDVLKDLYLHNVKIVTIGQYLQPTKKHLEVVRFVEPKEFDEYKKYGLNLGFQYIESGPLVRSSYHAERHL